MPVYNVEKYLPAAIESVLHQSFNDLELILVDDHSTDGSNAICDDYAQKDKRILTVHLEKNGGLSNARNCGLRHAAGKYVTFMDSDDYIDNNLCSAVYLSLKKSHAQIILFGIEEDYYDHYGCYQYSNKIITKKKIYDNPISIHQDIIELEEKSLYGYVWNKFYSISYLKKYNYRFQSTSLIEDIQFNISAFSTLTSFEVLDIAPYHYAKRPGNSLTHKFIPDYFKRNEERVQMLFYQYQSWNMLTHEVRARLAKIYTRYVFSALERNRDPRSHMTHRQQKEWLTDLFQSDLYQDLIPYIQIKGNISGLMAFLLRHKMSASCLKISAVLAFVKTKFPVLFSRMKRIRT